MFIIIEIYLRSTAFCLENKCFYFASLPNSWRSPLPWENIFSIYIDS